MMMFLASAPCSWRTAESWEAYFAVSPLVSTMIDLGPENMFIIFICLSSVTLHTTLPQHADAECCTHMR